MANTTEMIVVNCERDTASSIASEIDKLADGRSYVAERRSLDGSVADWILFGTLAVNALPHILNFIVRIVELRTVRSIKVGEIELTNPSAADVEDLKRQYLARREAGQEG